MKALEFHTKIQNGMIRIPENALESGDQEVKVILLWQEEIPGDQAKEKMAAIFKQLTERKAFELIDDPVAWQKTLRDEW